MSGNNEPGALLGLDTPAVGNIGPENGGSWMYQLKLHADSVPWSSLEFPGVSLRVLYTDADTGAMTVLTRMAPGAVIPAHQHTNADETVYVLEGDFVEDGQNHGPGSFFAGKAGTPHGPHRTAGGCLVLTSFSAPLDFVLVET
jgi:quercetin dioxygenase-like cupin family protein